MRDGGHTGQFAKNICVIKIKRKILGVGRHTNGMYTVDIKRVVEQKTLAAPKKDVSDLDVWNARLNHCDFLAVKCMEEKDVVWDMEMLQRSVLDDCS